MKRLVALGALACVALVGCAGGSSSPSGSTGNGEALSMPEYIKQADAICEQENARLKPAAVRIATLAEGASSQAGLQKLATALRNLASKIQVGLTKIQALEPPAAQRAEIQTMLSTVENQVAIAETEAAAVLIADQAKIEKLNELGAVNKQKYGELAQHLGFKHCGVG